MTDDSTVRDEDAARIFRVTLLDAWRRGRGSASMRDAGALLAEHGRGARLALAAGAATRGNPQTVDMHLETAGILPLDAGPLDGGCYNAAGGVA